METVKTSPSDSPNMHIIQYGMYTEPSSATNSSTPQCVYFPVRLFSARNSIGYSICNCARRFNAEGGRYTLLPFSGFSMNEQGNTR